MSLLEVKNLSVQFDMGTKVTKAVNGVSLSMEPGEIVGLIGESGSGKSTLVRAIMELLPPYAGVNYDCLFLEGGVRKAAMVFQDPLTYLNPSLTVGWQLKETIRCHEGRGVAGDLENRGEKRGVLRCLENRGEKRGMLRCLENWKEMDERAADLLEMAGIRRVKEVLGKYPFELSGGERQRIVLAIALACRPALLIADEPTTALDATVQRQILTRLKRIAREMEMAVILVSHDLGVIASLAERVLVMQEGEIVEEGSLRQIYEEPQSDCAKKLVENAQVLSSAARKNKGEDTKGSDCFLRVEHLSRDIMVEDVNFSVEAGECFGLAGESGCGKTTLARMLCGLVRPTFGEIYYQGERLMPIGRGRKREQTRQVQMLFQNPYASLNPCHTVGTTLEETLLLKGVQSGTARREAVFEMLRQVGLSEEAEGAYPAALSGGQRQRVALARVLLAEPRLLILDEPVSALDMTTQRQILDLLKRVQKERGLTYIFISHDLQAIRNMCDRLGVMYAGSIVESGNAKDVCNEPWHPYTKMLLQSVLSPDPKKARREQGASWLVDDVRPSVKEEGCPFACRCGYALECCRKRKPQTYTHPGIPHQMRFAPADSASPSRYTQGHPLTHAPAGRADALRPSRYHFANREVACFLYSEEHMGRKDARAQI